MAAAEKVAFDLFQPTLRSRGNIPTASLRLHKQPDFQREMEALFNSPPSGKIVIPTLLDAISRIEQLEKRLGEIEKQLKSR